MPDRTSSLRALVDANRILAHEGVVDAFGHVSVRDPERPDRYLLACSRSPELVNVDDIVQFTLDGTAIDAGGRRPYAERMIHGAVYEARPDVHAVVHHHAPDVVPFTVVEAGTLRAIAHVCAPIGAEIPTWDIASTFGETDMLVASMETGRDLAAALASGNVVLMRGHGATVAGNNLQEAVSTAIYLQINARLQAQAMQIGEPRFLTRGEIEQARSRIFSPLVLDRTWEYWSRRAGVDEADAGDGNRR